MISFEANYILNIEDTSFLLEQVHINAQEDEEMLCRVDKDFI